MFRRRSKKDALPPGQEPAGVDPPEDDDSPAEPAGVEGPTEGPWDVGDAPDDDVARLDLGGLRVPATPDIELRLEADPTGTVAGVVLVQAASTLAIGAFAAPRGQGIWDEVRAELLTTLRAEGAGGSEREGPFGTELAATVTGPDGRQAARFVGVDGPKWFLRGMFTGPAATNPEQARALERALRNVVVSRGEGALPVRGPLPLELPKDVLDQAADEAGRVTSELPVRGPEITEIR
ncbi:MAG: DUF3710 domain-containing protein [Pseudonocardiales bacterium]|nr:MAG: DUF3710 domain-containing protein [Pseudonocardiales bacterium]